MNEAEIGDIVAFIGMVADADVATVCVWRQRQMTIDCRTPGTAW